MTHSPVPQAAGLPNGEMPAPHRRGNPLWLPDPDDVIRAGEIGQYAYCARSWWLSRVQGHRSANTADLAAGAAAHRRHGRRVEAYHLARRLAVALLGLALVLLAAWAILSLVP